MFSSMRIAFLSVCLLCTATLNAICLGAGTEAELLAQLQNTTTSFRDKSAACKRLAVVGNEAAVPVLAALLDDDKLAHYARYALEPISSAKVDEALIAALDSLQGKRLIGVIQSLGNRGKAEAIDALAEKLEDADREVAKSAAHCIARLGTPKAGKIFDERLSSEFTGAALVCGKQLARQDYKDQAVRLLMKLTQYSDAAEHIRLAAMLQAIELQGRKGLELLADALASNDDKRRNTGLRTARLIDKADAAMVAREVLKDSAPSSAALLLTLLGDLADGRSLPVVVDAVNSDNKSVKVAALGALASLGGAEHVTLLVDAAQENSNAVAAAALDTLAALPGKEVDQAVLDLLEDRQRRKTVVELIGKRRIAAAVPQLAKMIDGPNQLEVVAALGETVSLDQLDILGKRLDSKPDDFSSAIRTALHAACDRMPNRSATVAKLTSYLERASNVTVQLVMDELRQIGGTDALTVVTAGANGDISARREYATQALGNWLDVSAAPALLALAQSEGDSKFGIRGIRGYIRLARQFSMSEAERLKMCRTALQTAQRVEDKKLVLAVLERYPSLGSLKIAVAAAQQDTIKSPARLTAQKVAGKIDGHEDEVKSLLAEINTKPAE